MIEITKIVARLIDFSRNRRKDYGVGLHLRGYDHMGQITRRGTPTYAVGNNGEYISQTTTKKDGHVFIPSNELKSNTVFALVVPGVLPGSQDHFLVNPGKIEGMTAEVNVIPISEKNFKHAVKILKSKKRKKDGSNDPF